MLDGVKLLVVQQKLCCHDIIENHYYIPKSNSTMVDEFLLRIVLYITHPIT